MSISRDLTESGRYYLRELENEGYVPDTELKTVYVKSGRTTEITWENIPHHGTNPDHQEVRRLQPHHRPARRDATGGGYL